MKRARVVLHYEDGTWWADSPDLDGFTVVASTLCELQSAVREAVAFHLESAGPVSIFESMAAAQSAADVAWVSRTGGADRRPLEPKALQLAIKVPV